MLPLYAQGTRTTRSVSVLRAGVTIVCLGALGCTGIVQQADAGTSDHSDMGRAGSVLGQAGSASFVQATPAEPVLPRLTATQYYNALVDLLGPGVPVPAETTPLPAIANSDAISAAVSSISDAATVGKYADNAFAAARYVFGNTRVRAALGICEPTSLDDVCIRSSLASAGERLWRRELSSAELDSVTQLVKQLDADLASLDRDLEFAFASLLQSPYFLYRVELGEPASDHPGWLRYTGSEMASRLSFALWQSLPDQALLNAAKSGRLTEVEDVRTQVERMLNDPRAERFTRYFLADYFHYADLDQLVKSQAAWTPALRADFTREFELLAGSVLGGDRDYLEILTSSSTFVNANLAQFYGISFPAGSTATDFVSVSLPPERRGVLTTGSLLARYGADSANPIHRGRFIRANVLCQPIADPPASLTAAVQKQASAAQQDSSVTLSRDRALQRLKVSPCNGCHALMDPIGLGFEKFDSIGSIQVTEDGAPTTSDGWLDDPPLYSHREFNGPAELADLLATDPSVLDCAVRNVYQRIVARPLAADGREEGYVQALDVEFRNSERRFRKLLASITLSDGFRYGSTITP